MKNTFGTSISVTLFGESHGSAIGCVIDGLAPGIRIDEEYISHALAQRQASGDISTPRKEPDEPRFLSGIKDGYTEGTPIALIIENTNTKSSAYSPYESTPRPGHADYTAECKYHGYQDKRGGGHFSGRITAPLVAAGAIVRCALKERGIYIGTHIKSIHGIADADFSDPISDINALWEKHFPTLSSECEERMREEILRAKAEGDSVGGVLETLIVGMPAGIGEPWFDTVEGMLSHILFSVPGIKGVEFGNGFALADMLGSEANDAFSVEDGRIITKTNSNGGINGGITNGMPILIRCAVKPTPSISKAQRTVDLSKMSECDIEVKGRHDPCIVHRARAVVDAVCALAVADLLATRFGTDYLCGGVR